MELIFNNVFSDLSVPQLAAILSCLVYTDGGDEFDGKLRDELQQPFDQLRNIARNVGEVMYEAGDLDGTEEDAVEEFVKQFRPDMMEIVFEWVNGKKFFEICKLNKKIYEGTIIRVMRRLEELISELKKATKVVGDDVLEAKFEECSVRIRRDIIFAASLYL